jgi:hypothetical protein
MHFVTHCTKSVKSVDLVSRLTNFYKKRDTEMGFTVMYSSANTVSIHTLGDFSAHTACSPANI